MGKIDDEIKTRFQNDKHRFIANLVYTCNSFNNLAAEYFKEYGISSQQFNILRILRGADKWLPMNTIKELMIDKAPNATRLSDKLKDKQLIDRKRSDTDRRVVYLKITEKGLALLEKMDKNNNGKHLEYLSRITEEEAKVFSDVLDKMRG